MNKKILIIIANYYEDIAHNLVLGATECCAKNDINNDIITVTGSFEIPFIINNKKNLYDGFIALGCIIRGETYHFEIISNQVSRKIMDLSIEINKPIGFGVLTCDTIEQALKRADPLKDNKGAEAAEACINLLNLK